jgi:hypothetical protein
MRTWAIQAQPHSLKIAYLNYINPNFHSTCCYELQNQIPLTNIATQRFANTIPQKRKLKKKMKKALVYYFLSDVN